MTWQRGLTQRAIDVIFRGITIFPQTKICTKCSTPKALSAFNPRADTGKLASWCRVCTVADVRDRRRKKRNAI